MLRAGYYRKMVIEEWYPDHTPLAMLSVKLYYCISCFNTSLGTTDPLHVTSRGVHSGLPWRTTEAVFYGENVQRLPLPLVCKEGCQCASKISLSWLAFMHNDGAIAPFRAR
jgi:hypothetical protein